MSLDLSYNDITYINISNGCWNTKIRYLNLNNNILASTLYPKEDVPMLILAPMSAGLETFTGSAVPPGDKNQEDLWDNIRIPEYYDSGDIKLSPLSRLFLQSPFSSFARYDFWIKDALKYCENFGTVDISQCILQEPKDICDLIERCISPDKHLPPCPRDMLRLQPEYFTEHMCSYKPCAYNIRFPFPPQLKSVSVHNLGAFSRFFTKTPTSGPDANLTLCIHPNNNLEVVDLPNLNLVGIRCFQVSTICQDYGN